MGKKLLGFSLIVFLFSCGGGKTNMDPSPSLMGIADSAMHICADSLSVQEAKERICPLEADELFDDFIFNYASDRKLQKQRTVFPLPYRHGSLADSIGVGAWKHIDLFGGQNSYSILFDREDDMELLGDTSLQAVTVEWFFLKQQTTERYSFRKISGMWMLESIEAEPIGSKDANHFISFYTRFVTDSIFQSRHIAFPLKFITIDPDDDFAVLETTLDINQWYAFRPSMPVDKLSNICYGQKNVPNFRNKILKVNGISNGYSTFFYFRRKNGEWELYKYEDTSI